MVRRVLLKVKEIWQGALYHLPEIEAYRRKREQYDVKCPSGHVFTFSREELVKFHHVEGSLNAIEFGVLPLQPLSISYTECPHPECVAETRQHAINR